MDVPLVSSQPLSGVSGINAVTAIDTLAIEQALAASPPDVAPTTVDLSPLGRFLSAAALFQKKILELQSAAAETGNVPDPDAIAAAAVTLGDAFSQLQAGGIEAASVDTGAPGKQSFAALFAQQFGGETVPVDAGQPATQASLAAIGLNFVPASAPDQADSLSIDQPLLQASLSAEPAATTTLLSQAAQAFATLAGVVPDSATQTEPTLPLAPLPAPALAPADQVFVTEAQFLTLPPQGPAAATQGGSNIAALDTTEVPVALAANPVATPAVPPVANALDIDPAVESVVNQTLAAQALAAQAREASAASLAADDTAQDQRVQERAAIDAQITEKADQLRINDQAAEQWRLARTVGADNPAPDAEEQSPLGTVTTSVVTQPAVPVAATEEPAATPVAPPALPDRAQQLARDPAIAAAIAAYNLNSGPFSALNGKPELAAARLKPITPVATVTRVAAIDTDGAAQAGPHASR